jgi:phosphoglycolate phosphatase
MRRTVLFDLDGTLSDSAPGILAALRHAFVVNGLSPLDEHTERALLGPPFYESLQPLIGAAAVPGVIAAYRDVYGNGGMFDTTAYAGMAGVLAAAQEAGFRLAVATSKPEHYAVPIVEYLGLNEYFQTIGGDELDGSLGTKALVIGKVLTRLGTPDPSTVLMVGDRSHDIEGARVHGIAGIGVEWGYALPGELAAAQPALICATPRDLARALDVEDGVDAEAS